MSADVEFADGKKIHIDFDAAYDSNDYPVKGNPKVQTIAMERMRALGLVEVRGEARLSMWYGGSAGASLTRANFEQLHDALIAGGYVTGEELEQDIARLDDPEFITPSPIMWTTWGRRPIAG